MTPYSIDQLRLWCLQHTKRGQRKYAGDMTREMAVYAFIREIGWRRENFYRWLKGKESIPARVRSLMTRFIQQWEAGTIEFARAPRTGKRILVHLERPRPRTRMSVALTPSGPVLSFAERPAMDAPMPTFRDLIGRRLSKIQS